MPFAFYPNKKKNWLYWTRESRATIVTRVRESRGFRSCQPFKSFSASKLTKATLQNVSLPTPLPDSCPSLAGSAGRLRGLLPHMATRRASCVRTRKAQHPGCWCMGHTVPSLAPPHFKLKVGQEHAATWAQTLNVHNINFNLKQQCYTVQLLIPTYFVS